MQERVDNQVYAQLTAALDAYQLAGRSFLTRAEIQKLFGRKDAASTRTFMRDSIGVVPIGNRLTCPLELVRTFIRDHYCPTIADRAHEILHRPVKRSSRKIRSVQIAVLKQ